MDGQTREHSGKFTLRQISAKNEHKASVSISLMGCFSKDFEVLMGTNSHLDDLSITLQKSVFSVYKIRKLDKNTQISDFFFPSSTLCTFFLDICVQPPQ